MSKGSKIFVIAAIFLLVVSFLIIKFESLKLAAFFDIWPLGEESLTADFKKNTHWAGFFEVAPLVRDAFKDTKDTISSGDWTQIGITSHHLPTALSFIADFYKNFLNSQGPRDTFVIIGPDHFERCQSPVSLTQNSYLTPFGELPVDKEIIDQLLTADAKIDDQCFDGEHSIGSQTIFIKYLFPDTKIVPVLLSSGTKDETIEKITQVLAKFSDRVSIIISVDFSHDQSFYQARHLDQESEQMLKNLSGPAFGFNHVDSPAAIKLAISLAKKISASNVIILGRANSYDFTGQTENTTGYINVIFIDYKKSSNSVMLMFVGDMMLSRAVGQKMEKLNNWQWPFAKIAEYLKEADLLFGNLEGSISDKGKNVGSIYSFRADPRAVEGLKFAGFDVLSVANNHIGDWGRVAMEDTFRILKESEIDYTGGGFSEQEAYQPVIKKIKGTKFDFLAYTALGARWTEAVASSSGVAWLDKERMISDIKAVKAKSDFVIVSIHFGDEYKQKSNSFQKEIARAAIDSGASLVIGYHPHVVQETEHYQGGWIAYSLGNFVFDQTFSEETMKGLLLKAVVEDKEIKNIELVKIKISKEFQVLIEN